MQLLSNDDDRGQVGIGTLIIFIALVLVAAVAAGVLVNTAGLLQAQAEDTGADAQSQVSNQIDVISATGTVNNNNVTEIELVVKKSAGSDPIDLSGATIQYTSSSDSATLNHETGPATTQFTTADIKGTEEGNILDNTGDRARVTLTLDGTDGRPTKLAEGQGATLRIVDQSGATTVYGVNVPDVLSGTYVNV